jgi:hypothetical protein
MMGLGVGGEQCIQEIKLVGLRPEGLLWLAGLGWLLVRTNNETCMNNETC